MLSMVQQTFSSIQRKNTAKVELKTVYTKLNKFIDDVTQKINARIQLVAQVYAKDYETQVTQMTEELKTIRNVLDEELLRQRANERLFFLEEERDFFRAQVMKLNEELMNLTKTNTRLKEELEQTRVEADNYKSLVVGLQKKIVKIQNEAFQHQKLKITPSIPLLPPSMQPVDSKQTISTFHTKPTLPRKLQEDSPLSGRTTYHSVELRRGKSEAALDSEMKRKEQILQECIKDVKKKIFYRTLGNEGKKVFFEEHKKISFQKFTRTDKEDLIRSILSDNILLELFYKFMTNSKEGEKSPSTLPHGIKTSINDRIFKIKLRGISGISSVV